MSLASLIRNYGPQPNLGTVSFVAAAIIDTELFPTVKGADGQSLKPVVGRTITNSSDNPLYIALGGVVDIEGPDYYTAVLQQDDYYEVPFNYGGAVHGIWGGSEPSGGAICREVTR